MQDTFDSLVEEIRPKAEAYLCDLDCFKECLELKDFASYNVIETCVTQKCKCQVDSTAATNLLADFDHVQPSSYGFWSIFWRMLLALAVGAGVFFGAKRIVSSLGVEVEPNSKKNDDLMDSMVEEEYQRIV